jgi:lysophosphatidate acyltransferase
MLYFKAMWKFMHRTTVIAKKQLFYYGPFGFGAWLCGIIFIDRQSPEKAKKTLDEAVEKLKKNNTKLWIFPEGEKCCSVLSLNF